MRIPPMRIDFLQWKYAHTPMRIDRNKGVKMKNKNPKKTKNKRINLSLTPEAACLAEKLRKKGVNLSYFFSDQLLWHFKRAVSSRQRMDFISEAMNCLQDKRDRLVSGHELEVRGLEVKIEVLAEKRRALREKVNEE